jgi:hypothetical protein
MGIFLFLHTPSKIRRSKKNKKSVGEEVKRKKCGILKIRSDGVGLKLRGRQNKEEADPSIIIEVEICVHGAGSCWVG